MIDPVICDRHFPYKWRSSVAVFSYEPTEENQTYGDMTISYLKVVCTITGFQPNPDEVGITNRRLDSYWNDPVVIDNYKDVINSYYGCYGAILEVAIAPPYPVPEGETDGQRSARLKKFPYFIDFEPKKRELYEIVSDTGETMSRSLGSVDVRKGSTTTSSHEVLDIFGGLQSNFQYAGTGGGGSIQGQWGTKNMNQEEYTNMRTSDQAREQRETFSHTTQLTQMYQQLSSYHLGTNRSVFFMLPRPHIVDPTVRAPPVKPPETIEPELTFVNGPRVLEGIQEFFLVVMRPKDTPEPCVEAYLETGHVFNSPIFTYETSTGTLALHVEQHAPDTGGSLGNDSYTIYGENSETFLPDDGWEVDIDRDGGFKIESTTGDNIEDYAVYPARDHVTAWGKVKAWFEDRTWPQSDVSHDGKLDMMVTVYVRKKIPNITGYKQTLYITGRGVCCCEMERPSLPRGDWLTYEKPLTTLTDSPVGKGKISVSKANNMRNEIGRFLVQSVNDSDRYSFGTMKFSESQVASNMVGDLVRDHGHPDNTSVSDIVGLDSYVSEKIIREAPRVSRGKLLQMSPLEQADRFDLTSEEVIKLRRALLGLSGPELTPKKRWDKPVGGSKLPSQVSVPEVVGMSLEDARQNIENSRLNIGSVTYVEDVKKSGLVVDQCPKSKTKIRIWSKVHLTVSSGRNNKEGDERR